MVILMIYAMDEDTIIGYENKFDKPNSYTRLLKIAKIFKEVGLTPIFLYDEDIYTFYATSKECLDAEYH